MRRFYGLQCGARTLSGSPSSGRWLITGSTGLLGRAVSAAAREMGIVVFRSSLHGDDGRVAFDLTRSEEIGAFLDEINPGKVIHLAAAARPAEVERQGQQSRSLNVVATAAIADWCYDKGRQIVFTSTDQVFGGGAGGPYSERDIAAPTTAYGRMKLAGENAALAAGGLVVRLGWVINDTMPGERDFLQRAMACLRRGETVLAADDELRTPIRSSAAADAIVGLGHLCHRGIVNVAGDRHVTPKDLIMELARSCGLDERLIGRVSYRDLAPLGRPHDVRLDTTLVDRLLSRTPADFVSG